MLGHTASILPSKIPPAAITWTLSPLKALAFLHMSTTCGMRTVVAVSPVWPASRRVRRAVDQRPPRARGHTHNPIAAVARVSMRHRGTQLASWLPVHAHQTARARVLSTMLACGRAAPKATRRRTTAFGALCADNVDAGVECFLDVARRTDHVHHGNARGVQLVHSPPWRDADGRDEERGFGFDHNVDELGQFAIGVIVVCFACTVRASCVVRRTSCGCARVCACACECVVAQQGVSVVEHSRAPSRLRLRARARRTRGAFCCRAVRAHLPPTCGKRRSMPKGA